MPGLRPEERSEVGEPREQNHAIAIGKGKQSSSYPFPVSVQRLRNFCCGERAAVTKNNGLGDDEAIGEGILFRFPRHRIVKTNQKPEGIMQKYTFVIACLTRADSTIRRSCDATAR